MAEAPAGPSAFWKRLTDLAAQYEASGQLPRTALFDIAFPTDSAEYYSLGGYGVILIAAVSQSKDELPLRRVFDRAAGSTIDLKLLTSVSCDLPNGSVVAHVVGAHAAEGLYLFPVYARVQDAELVIDFASKRDGFGVGRFSAAPSLAGLPIAAPLSGVPSNAAVVSLIARGFPGFLTESPPVRRQ